MFQVCNASRRLFLAAWLLFLLAMMAQLHSVTCFFMPGHHHLSSSWGRPLTTTRLSASSTIPTKAPRKKGYEPKWKKKETLSQQGDGPVDFKDKGLKGTIPVVFRQGNETKTTMALPGQLVRDVASQAGQFIKYGCGKGECGTCEALCQGQWIRPCIARMPGNLQPGEEYVVQVKQVKNKAKSSGKFYSVKSFLMGFWNNLIGMVGFVQYRKAAKKNWSERQEYEDKIKRLTMEKKLAKQREPQQQQPESRPLSP